MVFRRLTEVQRLELGSYSDSKNEEQNLNREQFKINDPAHWQKLSTNFLINDYLPSFCTSCYRMGRTGEHFMEFSVPGFIKSFCTPNAILTLAEYICDYGQGETVDKGWKVIAKTLISSNLSCHRDKGED